MKCFLCGLSDDNVVKFDDETFRKCHRMIGFRKKKNHVYGDITLTVESRPKIGRHVPCYKKVCVLKQKFKEEFSQYCTSLEQEAYCLIRNDEPITRKATTENEKSMRNERVPMEIDDPASNESQQEANCLIPSDEPITRKATTENEKSVRNERVLMEIDDSASNESQKSSVVKNVPRTRRKCLFCCTAELRGANGRTYVTITSDFSTISRVRNIATVIQDADIQEKLNNCNEIAYHRSCYVSYGKKLDTVSVREENSDSWHVLRDVHRDSFTAIENFIRHEIIDGERVYYMIDLYSQYKALFFEIGGDKVSQDDMARYRIEKLEKKIIHTFFDEISIEVSLEQSKKIVYKKDLDITKLAEAVAIADARNQSPVKKMAYEIRRRILSVKSRKLPNDNLSLSDVQNGECDIPLFLFELVSEIVRGPNYQYKDDPEDNVRIKSLCSDLMFITSKGRLKPAKNIILGLAMKSMTGSRAVLTTLNRYGHCISYTGAEEIETELTYTTYNENSVLPSGIVPSPNLCTGVAFDNFDCFVDTANGKDTLHDTVGIIYQFMPKNNDSHIASVHSQPSTSQVRNIKTLSRDISRKRRRFDEISHDVRPYVNGKKITGSNLLSSNEVLEVIEGCRLARKDAVKKDLLWVISLSQSDVTPMWLGFNANHYVDDSESQVVDYLPPINQSPTSVDVVHETLLRSKQMAEECGQSEIICTSDLAIAKIAMSIQQNSTPEFDNVFINVGAFHFKMANFKAIGKFIDSCGITDVLMASDVLAHGSLNGFLDCKHYNRCKRIHPLLLAAFRSLHFQLFASEEDLNFEMLQDDLKHAFDKSSNQELLPYLEEILCRYMNFCDLTLTGKHGKTAQFYMIYMTFIETHLRLSRSIRCSDFELYLDSIFQMTNLFFALNQPNYARYSILYVSNLMKLKLNGSDLVLAFRRGAFGIKRTKKSFSRSPVDLTLEQTINADAANTSTGIVHFTNSMGARQRWAISHSLRTKIMSQLKDELRMSAQDDVSHSMQNGRLQNDRKNLKAITDAIKNNLNPFDPALDHGQLFNISTGKAASSNVTDFLLNVDSHGEQQKVSFLNECNEDGNRFAKPIKRNKLLNFASDCVKSVQKSKISSKVAQIKMERDVFGRLLAIAMQKNIDIEYCLSFPLAPVPPALFQCNGDMFKTNKAVLASELKGKVDQSYPQSVDVLIVDGFYFLHRLGPLVPSTFEKISRSILAKLCSNKANVIHLIFDRYLTPSIKDCERLNRQEENIPYHITGPQQTRPADFYKSLKNFRFKEELVQFLSEHWVDCSLVQIYGEKKIFLTIHDRCFCFYCDNNSVIKYEVLNLQCEHEEADTRIAFHLGFVEPNSNVLVQANDTDVLIILLGNMEKFTSKGLTIWLEGPNGRKNVRDCVNCTELACNLGPLLCNSLPGFHAYTGCDYTAAFYLKGKKRPFRILKDNEKFQNLFASLQNPSDVFDDDKIEAIQEFTCLMYGAKKCCSVNLARFNIFQKTYSSKKDNEKLLKKIKGFDSTQIPPCWRSLRQKVLRTIYVNSMWQNVTSTRCTLYSPEECGWICKDVLKPVWFVGESSPLSVEDILKIDSNENNDEEDINNEPTSSDSETE